MNSNPFSPWDRALLGRVRDAAQTMVVTPLTESTGRGGKGLVVRTRFTLGESSVTHTEIRELGVTRVLVDATPLGAVVLIMEMMKRRIAPGHLLAHPVEKSGEYRSGAFEVAYGFVIGSALGGPFLQIPGESRRLKIPQLQELARLALP